jgi:hypothetical protein
MSPELIEIFIVPQGHCGGGHPVSQTTLESFESRLRDGSCGAFNESALTVSAGSSNNGWPPVNRPQTRPAPWSGA